jgi:hypothetical protein
MTPEYMTLAEALATKLPFRHRDFYYWIGPDTDPITRFQLEPSSFFEPVWQVQRPKPSQRILFDNISGHLSLGEYASGDLTDVTDILKDILKDGGE